MKELTINDAITESEFSHLEKLMNSEIPTIMKDLLKKYGGRSVKETRFIDINGKERMFKQFYMFTDINNLSNKIIKDFNIYAIPFAFDQFGFSYYLNFSKDDKGKIYIFQFDEDNEDQPLQLVSNSIEEFVNSLYDPDKGDYSSG